MTFSLSTVISVFFGLIGISLLVLVHELGHLAASRIFKINVELLQFGFGPAIKKWTGKRGTKYQIGIIPFGGFCRMKGQDDINTAIRQGLDRIKSCEEGSLYSVHPVKRIITYLSGPVANMLLAFLCYAVLLSMPVVNSTFPAKIVVESDYPELFSLKSCPAAEAGLLTGDTIVSVNGRNTSDYSELTSILSELKNESDVVFVTSDGKTVSVTPSEGLFGILPFEECIVGKTFRDSPEYDAGLRKNDIILQANNVKVTNVFDILEEAGKSDIMELRVLRGKVNLTISFPVKDGTLNFTLKSISKKTDGLSFSKALPKSVTECFNYFKANTQSIISVFKGERKAKDTISGTLSASKNIGIMAEEGFRSGLNQGLRMIFYLLGSVSISLAVANLLPITALDGGLILTSLAELITGRSFKPKTYLVLEISGLVTIFIIIAIVSFF